jgi:antitoxin MazE
MQNQANRGKGKVSSVSRTRLVKIGKSRGICLPGLLLDLVELDDEVELEVQDGQVIVRPVPRPRRGWEIEFDGMTARRDDRLLDSKAFSLTSWDEEKWVW